MKIWQSFSIVIIFVLSSSVNAAPITQLTLTGGVFSMGTSGDEIMPGEFANMTVGGYTGGERIDADLAVNSIGFFQWSTFGPMLISTRAADSFSSGFRPLTGDITDGELTLDLDSWTAWYNGVFYNQGASDRCAIGTGDIVATCSSGNAVTTYDAVTGAYTADWSAVFTDSSLNTNIATWHIEGTVSAVPVPAAVWLFGSGLVGLFAVSKQRVRI